MEKQKKIMLFTASAVLVFFVVGLFASDIIGFAVSSSANTCTESDGGVKYYTAGWSNSTNLGWKTDACLNTTHVKEYYCYKSGSYVSGRSTTYKCPYGCSAGACSYSKCSDSDNGKSYYAVGSINSSNLGSKTDACINTTHVKEYYCYSSSGNLLGASLSYKCTYGCANGTCKTLTTTTRTTTTTRQTIIPTTTLPVETCSDTDGGFVPDVQGATYGSFNDTSFNYTDHCSSNTSLVEYTCSNWGFVDIWSPFCQNGTQCIDGACV